MREAPKPNAVVSWCPGRSGQLQKGVAEDCDGREDATVTVTVTVTMAASCCRQAQ
jgi:hypothetical protein